MVASAFNNFKTNRIPLINKVQSLLGKQIKYETIGDRWKKNSKVIESGMDQLYFLVALFHYFDIRFPIDYSSQLFLPNVKPTDITNFLSNLEFNRVIRLFSRQKSDYPVSYLWAANKNVAVNYIKYGNQTLPNAKLFIQEFIEQIRKDKATEGHAYFFRKICSNPLIFSEESPFGNLLSTQVLSELFSLLIKANTLDPSNKNKIRGKWAQVLLSKKDLSGAIQLCDSLPDQRDPFSIYLRAQILFEQGDIKKCLDFISGVRLYSNLAEIRFKCFQDERFLLSGIELYTAQIYLDKFKYTEFPYLISCLKQLYQSGEFLVAEKYLKPLHQYFRDKQDNIHLSDIVYLRANMFFTWAITLNTQNSVAYSSTREASIASYLQTAMDLIAEGKLIDETNNKFVILEGQLLSLKGDADAGLKTILSLPNLSPYNIKTNYVISNLFLKKAKLSSPICNSSSLEAISYLERNIKLFEQRPVDKFESLKTNLLLAEIYYQRAEPMKGLSVLKKYVRVNDISNNDQNFRTVFTLIEQLESNL